MILSGGVVHIYGGGSGNSYGRLYPNRLSHKAFCGQSGESANCGRRDRFLVSGNSKKPKQSSEARKLPFREKVAAVKGCILANYTEWYIWKKYRPACFVPTICTLLFIVNIQRRGIESPQSTSPFLGWLENASTEVKEELTREAHRCTIGERVLLCDYGHYLLLRFIKRYRRI